MVPPDEGPTAIQTHSQQIASAVDSATLKPGMIYFDVTLAEPYHGVTTASVAAMNVEEARQVLFKLLANTPEPTPVPAEAPYQPDQAQPSPTNEPTV
jgi:adenosylmethionine-8-amino-7-oxononanoate aminotransferase